MGAGLGGFVDGITFHQILQWHNMLSAKIPPNDLVSAKINMYWDGLFHAAVWVLTVMGVFLLWRAGQRRDVPWSGRTFLGALSIGWGLFNVIEGTLDHQLLGIHHVFEYTNNKLPWDISYLVFGVVMLLIGSLLIRIGNGDVESRGEAA
jgi:Predicted membrane protein